MGGPIVVSPNPKKTSQRLMPDGRIIDTQSRRVVGNVKDDEIQQPPPIAPTEVKPEPVAESSKEESKNPLADAIKAQVKKAVEEQIKNIDIAGMVAEAMKEAFK